MISSNLSGDKGEGFVGSDHKLIDDLYISRFSQERGRNPVFNRKTRPKSLLDWLNEPSFFPISFGRERLETLSEGVFVVGREEVYRFPDIDSARDEGAFQKRWLAAVSELKFYQVYSPGLYLGIRAYRWEQGVPLWITDEPLNASGAEQFREPASGFAFVIRRVFSARTLKDVIDFEPDNAEKMVRLLSVRLREEHRQRGKGREKRFPDRDRFNRGYRINDSLREGLAWLQLSDRPAAILLTESLSRLDRLFSQLESVFAARALKLPSIRSAAPLDPERVIVGEFRRGPMRPFVLAPKSPDSSAGFAGLAVNDPLIEVAWVAVFLEAYGDRDLAGLFERTYDLEGSNWYDERIYRFFKMTASVAQVLKHCMEGERSSSFDFGPLSQVGFRYALGLDKKFILSIECCTEDRNHSLGALIGEQLALRSISGVGELHSRMRELRHFNQALHEQIINERMLSLGERELIEGRGIVFEETTPSFRPMVRALAHKHQIPHVVVCLDSNHRLATKLIGDGQGYKLTDRSDLIYVQPILSPAESIVWILREVAQAVANQNRVLLR